MSKPTWGILAEFDSAAAIYRACEGVRDAGFTKWDAHTPFPVHGLEKAMGLRPSILGWFVFIAAMTGMTLAMGFQWWMSVKAYPIVIAAKPLFSWQAFIPVTFEVTILFSALAAVFGMFLLNRIPTFHHPLFNSKRFERFSDDRFFISIEHIDPKYEESATRSLLQELGAVHIEMVEE